VDEINFKAGDIPTKSTSVILEDGCALYIYVPDDYGMPPNKMRQYMERVKAMFEEKLPGITVIVGRDDLHFTTITGKQVFSQKLAGNI